MLLEEVINIIESVAPLSIQEGWDNSGLQIGDKKADVSSVLLCTDVSEAIVDEAIAKGCQLIISHHPLLFHGLKTIQGQNPQERCVIKAIQHKIAIYSSHTSMDSYLHGVSGRMAEKLGIYDYRILSLTGEDVGLGVIGELPEAVSFDAFLHQVAQTFGTSCVRYTRAIKDKVRTIAMCGGAGAEFTQVAIAQGADVFISADFKYHEFQQAEGVIAVLDIGHFESEQFTKEIFAELLAGKVNTHFAEKDESPIMNYTL